jgi:coproporphyrinogen III oxidase
MTKEQISLAFQELQDHICNRLEEVDSTGKFVEDKWSRPEGGGGRTRILSSGSVIEKGGVNFSEVYGPVTEMMKRNTEITADKFFATGVSIVIHPSNPHVPIIHMNVRYFELSNGNYWFGGGIDLTPHYIVESQAGEFHRSLKEVCDKYDSSFYPRFKKWADDYFYLPHRDETRGVGGIFYDHLIEDENVSKEDLLNFSIDLGKLFPEVYEAQVKKGHNKEVLDKHVSWRNLRRGRYVEFNLVHDRGTKFGLVSGGRTESILMSLPANASWEYCHIPEKNSPEEQTLSMLKKDIDWMSK